MVMKSSILFYPEQTLIIPDIITIRRIMNNNYADHEEDADRHHQDMQQKTVFFSFSLSRHHMQQNNNYENERRNQKRQIPPLSLSLSLLLEDVSLEIRKESEFMLIMKY